MELRNVSEKDHVMLFLEDGLLQVLADNSLDVSIFQLETFRTLRTLKTATSELSYACGLICAIGLPDIPIQLSKSFLRTLLFVSDHTDSITGMSSSGMVQKDAPLIQYPCEIGIWDCR